jgi:hypothetical protein
MNKSDEMRQVIRMIQTRLCLIIPLFFKKEKIPYLVRPECRDTTRRCLFALWYY